MIDLSGLLPIVCLSAVGTAGVVLLRRAEQLRTFEVLIDTGEFHNGSAQSRLQSHESGTSGIAGRAAFVGVMIGLVLSLPMSRATPSVIAGMAIAGAAFSILFSEGRLRRLKEQRQRLLDYFLPIVMERIVMAVEAGLDIVPAIDAVVELERNNAIRLDPVTELFGEIMRFTESGIGFSDALVMVEQKTERPALKHAFVHLGLAYREGGEIIHPLRELSDATQLYFQESVEEEIAKMPVKATLPLLCTFAGLIISFLTAPVIQVMVITSQAVPG